MSESLPRAISGLAQEYLAGFRVLVLNGPRQAGKSTLLRQLQSAVGGTVLNLDDEILLASARRDPRGFVDSTARPLMIDEVQRVGDPLVRAVKLVVDLDTTPGQFALAGSTRFLAEPTLGESLAGRAGVLEVLPFAQAELAGSTESFLDLAFAGDVDRLRQRPRSHTDRAGYLALLARGGFPEPAGMVSPRVRSAWFANYVSAVTERDIREMARVNAPSAAGLVLNGLAGLSGQQFNATTLAQRGDLTPATVNRYTELLDAVFLLHRLRPWSHNALTRAVRRPKTYLVDTGLLCHLLGVDERGLGGPAGNALGAVLETFVVGELRKQATWAQLRVEFGYYRDSKDDVEVDLIATDPQGRVLGIEIKAAATVTARDFRHLETVAAKLCDEFVHGFVIHLGTETVSFGDKFTALPLDALWTDSGVATPNR